MTSITERSHYRVDLTMDGENVATCAVETIEEARYFAQTFIDAGYGDYAEIYRVENMQLQSCWDWLRSYKVVDQVR